MYSCGRNIVLSQARVAVRLLYLRLEEVLPYLRFSCKSQQNKEPTSGLEPLTCSSYEFACVHASLYWCVRFWACLCGFRWIGGVGLSIVYQCVSARLQYGCSKSI
jgi:hypothetical protein